jgi:hypothetical protein
MADQFWLSNSILIPNPQAKRAIERTTHTIRYAELEAIAGRRAIAINFLVDVIKI